MSEPTLRECLEYAIDKPGFEQRVAGFIATSLQFAVLDASLAIIDADVRLYGAMQRVEAEAEVARENAAFHMRLAREGI